MAKRRKTKRLIVALVADTHAGHKLAVQHPELELMDEHGETYTPTLDTEFQKFLNDLYQKHIDDVADLADGCPVLLTHNGDITHGEAFARHLSLVTLHDQIESAYWNLRRWYEHPRIHLAGARILFGTEVHNNGAGTSEAEVCRRLQLAYPDVDTRIAYHSEIAFSRQQGQKLDLAHHGPFPGSRKWLEGNSAGWKLKDAMLKELLDGLTPPRVYARAHYHTYVSVQQRVQAGGVEHVSDLIILPSYSGVDDYVRKVTQSKTKIQNGLVALEFERGFRKAHPLYEETDIRTREELDL